MRFFYVNRTRHRTAQWSMLFHAVSIGLGFISGIITFPLNIAYIPLDLYGAWLASGNIIAWATIFDPGLSSVTRQVVAKCYGGHKHVEVGRFAGAGILLTVVFSAVISAVAFFFVYNMGDFDLQNATQIEMLRTACYIAVIGIFLNLIGYAFVSINEGMQTSLGSGLIYTVSCLVAIIIQIHLLMLGYGVVSIACGSLVRGVLILFGNSVYMAVRFWKENIHIQLKMAIVKDILKSTSFTSLSKAAGAISSNLDSYIMTKLFNNESAPIFQATKAPALICNSFVTRPIVAIAPIISHLAGAGELQQKRDKIKQIFALSVWVAGFSAVGIVILSADFMNVWVGKHLYAGLITSLMIALSLILTAFGNMFSTICFALGKIKRNSIYSACQSLATVALMVVLGYLAGMPGVAIAPGIAAIISIIFNGKMLIQENVITKNELVIFFGEFVRIGLLGFIIQIGYYYIHPTVHNWGQFIVVATATMTALAILMFIFSLNFRTVGRHYFNKILTRFHLKRVPAQII